MDRVSQAQTKLKTLCRSELFLPVFLLEVRAQRATRETEALRAISTGRLRRPFTTNTALTMNDCQQVTREDSSQGTTLSRVEAWRSS